MTIRSTRLIPHRHRIAPVLQRTAMLALLLLPCRMMAQGVPPASTPAGIPMTALPTSLGIFDHHTIGAPSANTTGTEPGDGLDHATPPPVEHIPQGPAGPNPSPHLENTVALPRLEAVILQPAGQKGNRTAQQPISSEGLRLSHSPTLYRLILPYIGHPLTFQKMHELTGAIAVFFRQNDRAFISVTVPPQRVHEGVLHIDVSEYHLERITVHGNRWTPAWQVRQASNLTPNQTMALTALQTDLDWLNLNPFRTADLIYRPGSHPGSTDVDINVTDRFPVYGYAAMNNQADRSLGRLNWYAGASWGNAFGLGQILTYQFNRTFMDRFDNHTGSWTIPLFGHNALQIFGNYALSHPTSNTPGLINRGLSGQASIRWLHMFDHVALGRDVGLDGMIQLGFDWKSTHSDQFYHNHTITLSKADTAQFVVGYTGSLQDPWGQTQINNQFFYGPGGLMKNDTRRAYESIFPLSSPNYVYDRLMLTRTQDLPYGFSSTTKVTFQRASKNLLYSEQLMIGGMGNARGYFANTSFGSNGNAVSEEIFSPALSLLRLAHLPTPGQPDSNKLGIFWDWADNRQVRHVGTGARAATLASVGADITGSLNRHVNITFDAGIRLRRIHTTELANRRGTFCDFQIVGGF
ncbi:hypothetical protein NQF87_04715 [Bombella sp. TMW 2.2559]|uniref:Haemolysin activator HlyB C-terminal domain-containing protein n=1 Tax=Bombella dulcis TaxID=2967339 RepID=A0ABT3WBG0_9PROT|nr:ShlB/FhaC/HecB family hemolysin secretion/activation protein [Bombella dulcis]MCX5616276.1 hypothetical protein [Bombella dulcis]